MKTLVNNPPPSNSKKKSRSSSSSSYTASSSENNETRRRANLLRDELSAHILSNIFAAKAVIDDSKQDNDEFDLSEKNEASNAIMSAIDCAMATCLNSFTTDDKDDDGNDTVTSRKKKKQPTAASLANAPYMESVLQILNLAACFACVDGDGSLSNHVLSLATKYSEVDVEIIRVLGCKLLGYCGLYLNDSFNGMDSKKKKLMKMRQMKQRSGKIEEKGTMRHHEDSVSFLFGISEKSSADECEVDSWRMECMDMVAEAFLPRLGDKSQAVRNSAIQACAYLKNILKKDEDIDEESIQHDLIQALLRSVAHDSSFACRVAALNSLPLTPTTISYIIERIRDVKAKVRVEAISVIATSSLDLRDLTDEQRVDIVQFGLTERCMETYAATAQLICCHWMKSVRFDPITFLRLLDPPVNEAICEKAARVILAATRDDLDENYTSRKKIPTKEDRGMGVSTSTTLRQLSDNEIYAYKEGVSNIDLTLRDDNNGDFSLDVATIFYLRMICENTMESKVLSAYEKAETVGKLLPDIPVLCDILRKHLGLLVVSKFSRDAHSMKEEELAENEEACIFEDNELFICTQLLQICKVADLKEEGSRRAFVSLIREMLCSLETPDDLIECCVRALAVSHDTEVHFIQTISDVLYNVGGKDSLNSDADEKSSSASEIVLEDLRHLRSVSILSVVLESTSEHMASNSVVQSFAGYILPAVTSPNAVVREGGVCCLGKFAILSDEEMLGDFKPLLLKIIGSDAEKMEVRAQAALAASDLALRFESVLEPLQEEEEENEENEKQELCLSSLVYDMMNDNKTALVIIAAEVAAKLLFAGRLRDPHLVARLLMIYFDENFSLTSSTEGDDDVKEVGSPVRLEQILSLFFPAYCMKSTEGRDALLSCIPLILAMINDKITKRRRRKGSSWPTAKMIEYVCSIVDIADSRKQEQQELSENNSHEDTDNSTSDEPKESSTASSALMASIAIALFLTKESHNLTVTYLRTLCKVLGSAYIDVESDEPSKLAALKNLVDDLEVAIEDPTSHRSVEKLVVTLSSVELDVEDPSEDEIDDESGDESGDELIEAMKKATLCDARQSGVGNNDCFLSINDDNLSGKEADDFDEENETSMKKTMRSSRGASLDKSEGSTRRSRRVLSQVN